MVILFDELSIARDLKYNSYVDEVIGFEDLGGQRKKVLGKQICVFMVRGVFESWKHVLSFYVSGNSMPGLILSSILKVKNVKMAIEIGLNVRAIVCDQGPNNRNCYNWELQKMNLISHMELIKFIVCMTYHI